jgi:hypothetical protein
MINPIDETFTVTIAESGTVSTAADLVGARLVAIITPGTLTGTAMTFQGSVDNSTFVAVHNDLGAAISATVAASRYIVLDPADFAGIRYIKVVSGSAEAAARTITLVARPV